MGKTTKEVKWKKVSPGLWERKNTPKSVTLDSETIKVYQEAGAKEAESLGRLAKAILSSEE